MKNFLLRKAVMLICLLFGFSVFAQVGIGTVTPEASSVLDVYSTTQGMLFPRMTTAQKTAITSPSNGLMVYDTDLSAICYYKTSDATWNQLGAVRARTNYKLIKSTDVLATVLATELAAGGGTAYKLDASTYYEINGSIIFDKPIDLNNAYIAGLDANEDKLIKTSGNLFDGVNGGSIKSVTIVVTGGGKIFNLSGTATQNLLIRDTIIANSSNVGSVTGFGLVFVSVVQYVGNTTGIVYDSIGKLLISNAAWFGSNSGIYEKLQGTFSLVQKQGGFCEVSGSSIGFDVSSNPTITGDGIMELVVFTGTLTTGKYVDGYTTGSYSGFNFNNKWRVVCAGISNEGDGYATGALYLDRTLTLPTLATVSTTGTTKVTGTTIGTNLYRVSLGAVNNRLVYSGAKTRQFVVAASVSFDAAGGGVSDYLFFFVKYNGATPTILTNTETYIDTNSGNVQSFPITGTVTLNTGEYVELHVKRLSGSDKVLTFRSYNMSIK